MEASSTSITDVSLVMSCRQAMDIILGWGVTDRDARHGTWASADDAGRCECTLPSSGRQLALSQVSSLEGRVALSALKNCRRIDCL
jgi:hypothetical protein